MKDGKRFITDEDIDVLLSGTPMEPAGSFAERTLIRAAPVSEEEIDRLLGAEILHISPDFTERTLQRIHSTGSTGILEFPVARWVIKSGMAAAVLLLGLFTFAMWNNREPGPVGTTEMAQAGLADMDFEELLYLEETLSSANVEVLIELEKTVPISYFIDEVDS